MYLNHIYQLAASARSVVAENKDLRGRLKALQTGTSALVRPNWNLFLRSVVKTAESVLCKTLRCGFSRALECDQSASYLAFSPVQPRSSAFAPLSYSCQCE